MDNLKMYLVVKDYIDLGHAVNSIAHAALYCYWTFETNPLMKQWKDTEKFKKVTCVANDIEFEGLKRIKGHIVITEAQFEDSEVALAFCPRVDWPKSIKFLRLFGSEKHIRDIK